MFFDDLPINSMVILQFATLNNQRVFSSQIPIQSMGISGS